MNISENIQIISAINQNKHDCCVAIVADTWGSAPRKIGSTLAIFNDNSFKGSVSGGCIEADIITEAQIILKQKNPTMTIKSFGISNNDAWQAGLACGGNIKILIAPILKQSKNITSALKQSLDNNHPTLWALCTKTNSMAVWSQGKLIAGNEKLKQIGNIDTINMHQKSRLINTQQNTPMLLCCYPPPLRLIILGAVHIATHLANIAQTCGYNVHIIDPRSAWIQRDEIQNLNNITIHNQWSDTALQNINPDNNSAFVALTHDPKIDDPALHYLLNAKNKCFYIGALGSQKTHATRIQRLLKNNITQTQINTIHAPVGLNIGADNPAEIAISIIAEITRTLKEKT